MDFPPPNPNASQTGSPRCVNCPRTEQCNGNAAETLYEVVSRHYCNRCNGGKPYRKQPVRETEVATGTIPERMRKSLCKQKVREFKKVC